MSREVGPRAVVAVVVVLAVIIGVLVWRTFGGGAGQLTAAQAGLGKPMYPGEIPGQRAPIGQLGASTHPGR